MKAGLIYQIETVQPFKSPTYEADVYRETLEQIELADRLGFDSVWTVEHHFLHEFSYCSAPRSSLDASPAAPNAFASVMGSWCCRSIIHCEWPKESACWISSPMAGSSSGTGRATTMDEILGFGMTPAETRPRWAEAVEMIPRMWREDPFTHQGKYWPVEHPVSVIPKPVQKPHPPMWVACTNPLTFELAAQKGLGALCFTLGVELRDVAPRIKLYRDTIKHAQPVGQSINNQVSLNIMGLIDDNPKKAEDLAHDAVLWYVRKGFTLVSSVAEAKNKDESYKYLNTASKFDPKQITGDYYGFLKGDDLIAVGGASEALRIARRYRELGADQVLFFLQYGAIPHAQIMRSIEILGEKVLPEIQSWPTSGGITICDPQAGAC